MAKYPYKGLPDPRLINIVIAECQRNDTNVCPPCTLLCAKMQEIYGVKIAPPKMMSMVHSLAASRILVKNAWNAEGYQPIYHVPHDLVWPPKENQDV